MALHRHVRVRIELIDAMILTLIAIYLASRYTDAATKDIDISEGAVLAKHVLR